MKGIIFREFLNMVENRFDDEMVDTIIMESNLLSEDAYTVVGTYDYEELVTLIVNLSKHSNVQITDLLQEFGKYAFNKFFILYANMFKGINDGFTFLSKVEDSIHIKVLQKYMDIKIMQKKDSSKKLTTPIKNLAYNRQKWLVIEPILQIELMAEWHLIKDHFILYKIEAFAKKLNDIADQHKFVLLKEYANELKDDVENVALESLKSNLSTFPDFIKSTTDALTDN